MLLIKFACGFVFLFVPILGSEESNITTIRRDLTSFAFKQELYSSLQHFTDSLHSFDPIDGRQDGNQNRGLGFICEFFEKQFTIITGNQIKICCGDDSGTSNSCKTERCVGDMVRTTGTDSRLCCNAAGNRNFCAGPSSSTSREGIEPSCGGASTGNWVDPSSGSARVCCVNSYTCGRPVACSLIQKHTTPSGSYYHCCSGMNGIMYCDQPRQGYLQTPPSSKFGGFGGNQIGPIGVGPVIVGPETSPVVVGPQPGLQPGPQPGPYPPRCLYYRSSISTSFDEVRDAITETAHSLLERLNGKDDEELQSFMVKIPNEIAEGILAQSSLKQWM